MQNKKVKIIDVILEKLTGELVILTKTAKAAHDAATHDESRAEDHHDTRGIEASYLAEAQGHRIRDLEHLITLFRNSPIRHFKPTDTIDIGALVELELLSSAKREPVKAKSLFYFLSNHGGGLSISVDGVTIQIITPQAPIGEALLDKRLNDHVEVEGQDTTREFVVKSVV